MMMINKQSDEEDESALIASPANGRFAATT